MATIEELRALLSKATKGPWVSSIETDAEEDKPGIVWAEGGHRCIGDTYATDDADAIVAMRNSFGALLDVAETARAGFNDNGSINPGPEYWDNLAAALSNLRRSGDG